MPPLRDDSIEHIVSLVEPFCRTENERIVLIDTVFMGAASRPDIDIHGAPGIFTRRLIHRLIDYGAVAPDTPALWALLDGFVRGQVGLDKQAKIDALRAPIFAAASAVTAAPASAATRPRRPPLPGSAVALLVLGAAILIVAAGAFLARSTPSPTATQGAVAGNLPTQTPPVTAPASPTPAHTESPTAAPSSAPTSALALPTLDTSARVTPGATSSTPPAATMPAVSQGSYPCTAVVRSPTGATLLNVVRANPSSNAPPAASIRRGDNVKVQRESSNQGTTWYLIENQSGVELGWVETQYLTRSLDCP